MQRPYYNRGLAHEGQGDIDTALADDEKALELFKQTGDTKSYDMLVEYVKQQKPQ